jgi:hypothetical protein
MAQGDYKLLKQRMQQRQANNANRSDNNVPRFTNPQELVKSGRLPSTVQVRFPGDSIDDVFTWAWCHEVPMGVSRAGNTWKQWQTCLDQSQENPSDCPACQAGLPLKQRFWANLIWRDAPIFETNDWGSPVKPYNILGNEDRLVVWNTGPSLFSILDEVETQAGDVTARDVKLKIVFKGQYTLYELAPFGQPDPAELSEADKKLADQKFDLNVLKKPMAYNDMAMLLGAAPRQEDAEEEAAQSFTGGNPYESAGEQVNSPLARPRN